MWLLLTQTSVCLIRLRVTKERSCLLWCRWGLQDTPSFMLRAKGRASWSVSVATVWLLVTSATAEHHSAVDECPQMNYQSLGSRLRNTDFLKILVKDEWNYSKGGKSILNHLRKANDDLSKHPRVTNDYQWYCWCLTASTSRTCPIMLYFTSCLQLTHPPSFIGNAVNMTEALSFSHYISSFPWSQYAVNM